MTEIKDHRPRPYTIIEDIIIDCNLCVYEKMVLICIMKYAGKAGQAWPGIKTVARTSGMSERHVRRTLRQLEDLGLLRTVTRPGRSSLYHIPEYTLHNGTLTGIWLDPQGADQLAAPPGPPVRTPRTNSPPTPACQSAEQYQRTVSMNLSLEKLPGVTPQSRITSKDTERDYVDLDLVAAWEKQFSLSHRPENQKELLAMDWMLFATKSNQLVEIRSPLAYLKTVVKQGHPLNHPPFKERLEKEKQKQIRQTPTPMQRWSLINQVHRNMYFIEAREKGAKEDQVEQTAFYLFAAEYENELKRQRNGLSCNAP